MIVFVCGCITGGFEYIVEFTVDTCTRTGGPRMSSLQGVQFSQLINVQSLCRAKAHHEIPLEEKVSVALG